MNRYQIALKKNKLKRFYIETFPVDSFNAFDIQHVWPEYKNKELWIMDRMTGIVKETFSIHDKAQAQKRCRQMNRIKEK
jgi:hypothetical protein